MMKQSPSKIFIGFICGIAASILWGFHAVLIRYLVLQGVHPVGIAVMRLLPASIAMLIGLLAVSFAQKKPVFKKFPFQPYFWIAVVSLALNFLLFHTSLKYTIASDAILLEGFSPVVVFVLLLYFTPERLKHIIRNTRTMTRFLLVVLGGSIGSSLLIINDPKDILLDSGLKLKGDLLAFGAMFFFGTYMFANHEFQRRTHEVPVKMLFFLLFFAGLLLAPFVPWQTFLTQLTPTQWIWIFVLSLGSTGSAYIFWQLAAKYLEAVPLALLFFSLSGVFNVGVESLIFHLKLSPILLVGGLLILGSSIITQLMLRKEEGEHFEDTETPTL